MATMPNHCRSTGRGRKARPEYAFQLRAACALLRSTRAGGIEAVTLSLPVTSTTMEALLATLDLDGLHAKVTRSESQCTVRLRRMSRPDAQPPEVG